MLAFSSSKRSSFWVRVKRSRMEVSVSAPLDFSLAPRPDVKLPGDPASDSSSAFRVVTPKGKQGLQNFYLF